MWYVAYILTFWEFILLFMKVYVNDKYFLYIVKISRITMNKLSYKFFLVSYCLCYNENLSH